MAALLLLLLGTAASVSLEPGVRHERPTKVPFDPRDSEAWLVGPGGEASKEGYVYMRRQERPRQDEDLPASHLQVHHLSEPKGDSTEEGPTETVATDSEDTVVSLKDPIESEGELLMVEERNAACLEEQHRSVDECIERYGSYGIRRLFTESYERVKQMGWERKEWMAEDVVQNKQLFELTLPMTHASGSYKVQSKHHPSSAAQSYTVWQQLRLGVRALDLPVAVAKQGGKLYTASGKQLTAQLNVVLLDVRRFLAKRPKEIVYLFVGKNRKIAGDVGALETEPEVNSTWTLEPLLAQDKDSSILPGQMVHDAVKAALAPLLANYTKLEPLPENPTVSELVKAKARVLYFWEGQLVLCTTHEDCRKTPGWTKHTADKPLAFGSPDKTGQGEPDDRGKKRIVDPFCLAPSLPATSSNGEVELTRLIEAYSVDPVTRAGKHPPLCLEYGSTLPALGSPNLLHVATAYLSLSEGEKAGLDQLLGSSGAFYTRGEPLTARSRAERLNLLMLRLFFRNRTALNHRPFFTHPNFIAVDYVHPIIIHRIVESMQSFDDCGYTLYCMNTGGCAAMSKLGDDRTCLSEEEVYATLKDHLTHWQTAAYENVWLWRAVKGIAIWLLLKVFCVGGCMLLSPFQLRPHFERSPEGLQVLFKSKEAQAVEAQAAADSSSQPTRS